MAHFATNCAQRLRSHEPAFSIWLASRDAKPTFPRCPPNSWKSYHRFTAKRTASLPQPSDGLILEIGPRPEGHCPNFPPFRQTPPVVFTWPSIFPAYAGTGLRRRSSIRLRIFRNSSLGTATSANWNVTYRPCRTTFAPILTSFSRSVVKHIQRLASPSLGGIPANRSAGATLWRT